jgi:predicted transcriptional regulator
LDTLKLIAELKREYDELGQTIRTLERRGLAGVQAGVKTVTRQPRVWTAKQKAALSKAAKARWAGIKSKKKTG